MRRTIRIAAITALALTLLALAGCAGTPGAVGGNDKKTESGMKLPKVWGYVASAADAKIELAEDQTAASELAVDLVKSPGPAWIVVHIDEGGMPGARVGLLHVDAGETRDMKVPMEGVTSENVIVAVHADKGKADEFDFDMMDKAGSPDRPYFVDEKELAKAVKVRTFGVEAEADKAAIEVADQPGATGELIVARAVAPTGAWVVVHLDDDGMPGKRVGLLQIPAGTSTDLTVKLTDGVELTDKLFVAVHADRGIEGTFEFDMGNKVGSPDQPFFVDGKEVATAAKIK